jgi:hypothetical protein
VEQLRPFEAAPIWVVAAASHTSGDYSRIIETTSVAQFDSCPVPRDVPHSDGHRNLEEGLAEDVRDDV